MMAILASIVLHEFDVNTLRMARHVHVLWARGLLARRRYGRRGTQSSHYCCRGSLESNHCYRVV